MAWDPDLRPQLRPVKVFRLPEGQGEGFVVCDPSGMSDVMLTLPDVALHLMTMMDGQHRCEEIQEKFAASVGLSVSPDTLQSLVQHLEHAHLLEGPAFESYYDAQRTAYRSKPVRELPRGSVLRSLDSSGAVFDDMLADVESVDLRQPVAGLVAPHLDYARGRPCYAQAYAALRGRPTPTRVVILGTNHFPRATGVVGTAKHFVTPLGLTRTDEDFLARLEAQCGDLREHELDHGREHSVELQVAWLQHLFGAEDFEIVPFLCPDPCGPTGTAPYDGRGVDLREFAVTLGGLVAESPGDTLIVAGADLSHVGPGFGDDQPLDDACLREVRARDQQALAQLVEEGPDGWIRSVAQNDNATRICSAGCIFTLAAALPDASPTLLGYHQAVDPQSQEGVTCAAIAFI